MGLREIVLVSLLMFCSTTLAQISNCSFVPGSFYDFEATELNGNNISFSQFSGQVLLVQNVASFWGLTVRSYTQSNELKDTLSGKPFEIIGFPSNQFGEEEPGENYEILNCLEFVRPGGGFIPNFPLMAKIDVNGADEHPVYTWLKSSCGPTMDVFLSAEWIDWDPVSISDIQWNFEMFLIDNHGQPFRRYNPEISPNEIYSDIMYLLEQ